MIRCIRALPVIRLLATLTALAALSGCATPAKDGALSVGQEVTVEGNVVSVNTDPWTYDGNAVVTVSTDAGSVSVQLPARWNLCKAQPLGDIQGLKPQDRVQVVGTVTAPGEMVVCAQPQHRLTKME
jgi:hypothetical protein